MIELVNIVGVYAPEDREKEGTYAFYDILQTVVNKIPKEEHLVIAGNLNAKIGNSTITVSPHGSMPKSGW